MPSLSLARFHSSCWLQQVMLLLLAAVSGSFEIQFAVGYHVGRRSTPSARRHVIGLSSFKLFSNADYNNNNNNDEGVVDESFDLYSRDMRDQVRRESSEYLVIDTNNDGASGTLRRLIRKPFQWMGRKIASKRKPGKLILLSCGQSEWNANGTFTGKQICCRDDRT